MSLSHSPHPEKHKSQNAAWLRAAVLGANDGIVSTSSLMLGVLAASQNNTAILTAGIAGLVAGALSMAAGEYVSVSSQRDSEIYDISLEKKSLHKDPDGELRELALIYEDRGLTPKLAMEVAKQLHANDPVLAHARDELGINHDDLANPTQAAVASASSFALGAFIPIIAAILVSNSNGGLAIVLASLVALFISGAIGAYIGGGNKIWAAFRVLLGGGAAMLITYLVGHLVGVAV